jgi:indolepyruvate ferredoxin oxidoreductase
VGFKLTTNVADEFSTARVSPSQAAWVRPEFEFRGKPWQPTQSHTLFAPYNLDLEQELWEGRLEAARHFAVVNGLNCVVVDPPGAWIGMVAAGKTFLDLREALARLDLGDDDLLRLGIRLLRIDQLYPLDPTTLRRFAERAPGSARHRGEALLPGAAGARRALQHARSSAGGGQAG